MFVFANTKITLCNNILTKQYQNSKKNVSGTNIVPCHFFNPFASNGKVLIQQVEKQTKKSKNHVIIEKTCIQETRHFNSISFIIFLC